jgi:hypothetical protein
MNTELENYIRLLKDKAPIEVIDLGSSSITNDQLAELARLIPGSNVKTLHITLRFGENKDEGLRKLFTALPYSNIKSLHLEAEVTGEALNTLIELLPYCSLKSFDASLLEPKDDISSQLKNIEKILLEKTNKTSLPLPNYLAEKHPNPALNPLEIPKTEVNAGATTPASRLAPVGRLI